MPTSDYPDPIYLLRQLTADELAARIGQIDGERQALSVLLRAARARERQLARAKVLGTTVRKVTRDA
jgi:hypothetical protein